MRTLLALFVIIYLVGVGMALSPTIRSQWDSVPAPQLAANIGQELPNALSWPARSVRSITNQS